MRSSPIDNCMETHYTIIKLDAAYYYSRSLLRYRI